MKRYMAFVLNNDARCVNAVETQDVASLQPQPASVETRFIASLPYFPPYLIHRTTSVASGIPSPAQPYYLIYYMETGNKGLRLAYVCARPATEVVSFDIKSKIRYAAIKSCQSMNQVNHSSDRCRQMQSRRVNFYTNEYINQRL